MLLWMVGLELYHHGLGLVCGLAARMVGVKMTKQRPGAKGAGGVVHSFLLLGAMPSLCCTPSTCQPASTPFYTGHFSKVDIRVECVSWLVTR